MGKAAASEVCGHMMWSILDRGGEPEIVSPPLRFQGSPGRAPHGKGRIGGEAGDSGLADKPAAWPKAGTPSTTCPASARRGSVRKGGARGVAPPRSEKGFETSGSRVRACSERCGDDGFRCLGVINTCSCPSQFFIFGGVLAYCMYYGHFGSSVFDNFAVRVPSVG